MIERRQRAFTIIELLVVMAVIIVLAGLILGTSSYVQKKGARSRAEAEIAAMSAACESYKADNGIYPRNNDTDTLDARQHLDTTKPVYQQATLFLYEQLSGSNAQQQATAGMKSYLSFKPQMLGPHDANGNVTTVQFVRDPFGNSYGYSTVQAANPGSTSVGYNPTFDLWSTTGSTTTDQWIKNW